MPTIRTVIRYLISTISCIFAYKSLLQEVTEMAHLWTEIVNATPYRLMRKLSAYL